MAAKRTSAAKRMSPTKPRAKAATPAKADPAGDPAGAFAALAQDALDRADPDAIADQSLHRVLAAAVRLYAAKAERRGGGLKPFGDDAVTATETVVAVCAMIRAADLSPFDVAMWFNRLPS
jgi:hypothetical protein